MIFCFVHVIGYSLRVGDPGIESLWGRDFPQASRPVLGPTQPPMQWVLGLFTAVKRSKCGVNYQTPPHLAPRLKKE
jgi:hypothetical protein